MTDPIRVAKAMAAAASLDATGSVSTVLQKILAVAIKAGAAALPAILDAVFTVLEGEFPAGSTMLGALEAILANLLKSAPAPVPAV